MVSDVDSYKLFLPWCKDSMYLQRSPRKSMAKLVVGFHPLRESYTAAVLTDPPFSMRVSDSCRWLPQPSTRVLKHTIVHTHLPDIMLLGVSVHILVSLGLFREWNI